MTGSVGYVLDSNVFIQAKNRYYRFALCPGFWNAILLGHARGSLCSIDNVRVELLAGNDDLCEWVKKELPKEFFHHAEQTEETLMHYSDLIKWVIENDRFKDSEKAKFADVADGWIVAYARATNRIVATHEAYSRDSRRVLIPNLCREFGVSYCDPFDMLEALRIQFVLSD